MQPRNSRPILPPLVLARLTNPDQRRSTPQPSNRQLVSPHTPVNPQSPPSIAGRFGTESPRSALDSPATTFAGEDADEYQWTDDQIETVIHTLEEGSVGRPSRFPQTPYSLRFVPDNLLFNWARALKRTKNWPHSVRSIRNKLKEMSITITNPVQDDHYLDDEDAAEALMDQQVHENPISPRKLISERVKDKLTRSAARCQDTCESTLLPKFHPYPRPGAISPVLSSSSTRSFKHSGRGLNPSPVLFSNSDEGVPNELPGKSEKPPTPFRSVTPSPTSSGLEAGYDDPPVVSVALETSPSKFRHSEFTQFRSPVRPSLDFPETPAGPPTSPYLMTIAPSPLPALSTTYSPNSKHSGTPFPSAFFGTTLMGTVYASIENLKLATPKPSRAIQRSQSFTARPGDGVKRAPTYGGEAYSVAELFVPPSHIGKVPATTQPTEHGEGAMDPDATVKPRSATRRKPTTTTSVPSAWDTRKKADKRPRTTSSSDTDGLRSLVPIISPSKMDISPTSMAGISRGGVRVKRARKEDVTMPTRITANKGRDAVASRLTRSSKKLTDTLGLSIPSSSSSRSSASPGSPMITSPLRGKTPIGPTTKRHSTSHRRATSLLASGPTMITKEQLQDENQDTSMIVIGQPERRSSSPAVTRNMRRVGAAQFPPKVKRTRNQSRGDAL